MVLAMRPPKTKFPAAEDTSSTPFALWLRCYGPGGVAIARRYVRAYRDWSAAGQPTLNHALLRLLPKYAVPLSPPDAVALERRYHTLLIDWQPPRKR